ncbi:adenylate kinase-domain-containing protein [Mucidula mucida]|nr:adenylate kinase-domain-containing protein [Mucidula mucida]
MLALRAGRVCPTTTTTRAFTTSTTAHRALPFFLDTLRAAAQETREHSKILSRDARHLRMIMFGKPGAGKGTLSARLVKKYDILSLSAGDLLRQHIMEGTEVGRMAESIVAQGGLVSDEIMLKVITSKLDLLHNRHWILDGFPRTLVQGELLDSHLKKQGIPLSLIINIDVPDEVILSRISDRFVHLPSGRVYNMSYNRPKVDGLDDETGEPLTKRPDDNPEIFERRLKQFYSSTSPLLSYYATASSKLIKAPPHRHPHQHPHQLSFHTRPPHKLLLKTLTGTTSDEIWPQLDSLVLSTFPGLRVKGETQEAKRRHSLSEAMMADGLSAGMAQE